MTYVFFALAIKVSALFMITVVRGKSLFNSFPTSILLSGFCASVSTVQSSFGMLGQFSRRRLNSERCGVIMILAFLNLLSCLSIFTAFSDASIPASKTTAGFSVSSNHFKRA